MHAPAGAEPTGDLFGPGRAAEAQRVERISLAEPIGPTDATTFGVAGALVGRFGRGGTGRRGNPSRSAGRVGVGAGVTTMDQRGLVDAAG